MLHSKIRRDARSMIVHGHLPNVKHGGKVKANLKEKFQDYVDFTSKDRKKKTFIRKSTCPKKIDTIKSVVPKNVSGTVLQI